MFFSKTTGGFYDSALHGNNIPADAVVITDAQHAALLAGQTAGKLISADATGAPVLLDPPPPSSAQLQAACIAAIQEEMDRQAKTRGYYNLDSCGKYAALPPGSPFQAESAAFVLWCANVWHQAYAYIAQVAAGAKPMPTPDQAVQMMPPLVLPS